MPRVGAACRAGDVAIDWVVRLCSKMRDCEGAYNKRRLSCNHFVVMRRGDYDKGGLWSALMCGERIVVTAMREYMDIYM